MLYGNLHIMRVVSAAAIALLLLACASSAPPPSQYRIIAYVRGEADIERIGATKLTHVNYAFALVSAEGEVILDQTESTSHLARLRALKSANPDLKVLISIGGWGADHFSDAALTDQSRQKFARTAIELVRRHGLDGIDIDWEYPGQPGPGIKYRPEDQENFTLLLKTAREQLDALGQERGQKCFLSIASAGGEYFEHTEMDRLHKYVDWINIMTYDFHGSWTPTTGHHTGLYRSATREASQSWTEALVAQHLGAGIPREKLVVGVAFYGRAWSGVRPENRGLGQLYEGLVVEHSYAKLAAGYVDRNGFTRYWDEEARAPYLWSPTAATFISYDDPHSLKEKARFVKSRRLGGIMYWEHSHDPDEILLDVLAMSFRAP